MRSMSAPPYGATNEVSVDSNTFAISSLFFRALASVTLITYQAILDAG
tara:strand:+ start:1928 stop:2071 length:144 start_codon:yes stop_codon:yes gene_type:complete